MFMGFGRLRIGFIALALTTFCLSVGTSALAAPLKVGVVLDKGGKDDKSFNASAYKGVTEAQKKLGITLKVVESSDDASLEASLRTFAQRGFDLVIGIGFVMVEPMTKVAAAFPKVKFLIMDGVATGPNIRSLTFKEQEGSFLVGALAALTTKTKTVGFIGGMDVPLIRRFERGYRAGVQHIDPTTKTLVNYVGSTSEAWRDPTKGKELAVSQYNRKADIIFSASGASGMGVFDAAEELKKLVIGCDSNQNGLKPGRVLTSMVKHLDNGVYATIEQAVQGKFESGTFQLGLKEGAIDYVIDSFNRPLVSPANEAKINSLKKDIISGKIKVPDYYAEAKS